MNTENLQLEGLYIAIPSLNGALVAEGLLTVAEVDAALATAEQTALRDYRAADNRTLAQREAVAFPVRLLRLANNGSAGSETQTFSELAKMGGQLDGGTEVSEADEPDGEVFYESQNGDRWLLATDVGGRQFVRHIPNPSSAGVVELTDLGSFLNREPHSPQHHALAAALSARVT